MRGIQTLIPPTRQQVFRTLKNALRDKDIMFQLVPPGCHRCNAAERAICSFKNHFIARLCSVDPDFPLILWCYLLEQAELTLNVMRPLHLNPKVSVYNLLSGIYDFNSTPLVPPGIGILGFKDTQRQASWGVHGQNGWYVGPVTESYQCHCVYTMDRHTSNHYLQPSIMVLQENPDATTILNRHGASQNSMTLCTPSKTQNKPVLCYHPTCRRKKNWRLF